MDELESLFLMVLFSRLIPKRIFTSQFVMHPRYEAFGVTIPSSANVPIYHKA